MLLIKLKEKTGSFKFIIFIFCLPAFYSSLNLGLREDGYSFLLRRIKEPIIEDPVESLANNLSAEDRAGIDNLAEKFFSLPEDRASLLEGLAKLIRDSRFSKMDVGFMLLPVLEAVLEFNLPVVDKILKKTSRALLEIKDFIPNFAR